MWVENFYIKPWPHLVIDNFYDDETWEYVCNKESLFKKYKDKAHLKTHGVAFQHVEDPVLESYFSKKLTIDFLVNKFRNHREFDDLFPVVHLKVSRLPKLFGIHDEVADKVFSVITFIDPEHSVGTILFDKDKTLNKVITWKPNRAVIFAPIDNVSWHSYGNWDSSDRYTVDFFWERHIQD